MSHLFLDLEEGRRHYGIKSQLENSEYSYDEAVVFILDEFSPSSLVITYLSYLVHTK